MASIDKGSVMRLTMILALCAGPALADPLDLIDYDGLFEANAADVEISDDDRSVLKLGDVSIIQDRSNGVQYTGVDQSGEGAVGCFVSVLASLEGVLRACDIALTPEQEVTQGAYRDDVLAYYGRNVQPEASLETVVDRYNALVAAEVEIAKPFCDDPEQFIIFADRLFAPEARAEIEGMMSTPRLPVINPCL